MAEDFGLLAGLGKGLNAGLDAYNSERDRQLKIKQYQDELEAKQLARKQQQENQQMEATSKGLIKQGDGTFSFSPEEQKTREMKAGLLAAQAEEAKAKAASMSQPGMTKQDMAQDRFANMAHQKNIQALKRDPQLLKQLTQTNNLGAALNNLANAEHITPQQFDEAQQAIRGNLGIKGNSGIGEREKSYLNSLGLDADRFQQFLTGDPKSMRPDDPFLMHIKNLAQLEQQNIQNQTNSRISAVTGGNDWMYNDPKYKKYKDSLDSLVGATKQQFTSAIPQDRSGLLGHGNPGGAQQIDPDAVTYAQMHKIPVEQAAVIVAKRKAGQ